MFKRITSFVLALVTKLYRREEKEGGYMELMGKNCEPDRHNFE